MIALKQNRLTNFRSLIKPRKGPFLRIARWARFHRARVPAGHSSWQGGSFAPRCIPATRSVAPWTSPDALRLLDFRPGRFHQPLDPRPLGDFALPPDPHRPGVCRPGPARGLCTLRPHRGLRAPGPWPGRSAPEPLTDRAPQAAMAQRGVAHGCLCNGAQNAARRMFVRRAFP